MSNALLLKFREATSIASVTRADLKAISDRMGLSETAVIHIALARMYQDIFPEQMANDLPAAEEVAQQNQSAPSDLKTVASLKDLFAGAR